MGMSQQATPYPAPEFTLLDQDDQPVSLKDYRGEWLVLYFYPKDDTPGCTLEACSLRDSHAELADLGASVVGISRDDSDSHQDFASKHGLHFTLLSDPDAAVMKSYGAWGPKMFGREGVLRKTFLIDPNGHVQKVYGRVTPLGHGQQVKSELERLQQTS